MRVVGGSRKGRKLFSVKGPSTRPTSDMVREAVFDVLQAEGPFERVLDLFAGTGAMGIEALSRGSVEVVFVDSAARAAAVIRKNLEACGFEGAARVLKKDALSSLSYLAGKGESFDLVFMDAPYREASLAADTLRALADGGVLTPGAVVICEADRRTEFDTEVEGLELLKRKRYGDTAVYFFRYKER
ncbi:MAG: 16S rRNA (guanine(966)-N(2))-methyltransferase RsmD [Thermodesulfobacteriota bacterium]